MNPYTLFRDLLFRPVIRLLWRPWLEGEDNIPATGPVILVSNHVSWGDTLITPAMIRRQMTFPAKADLFETEGKGPAAKLVAWFLTVVGIKPMDRAGGRASVDSLGVVAQVLDEGGLVLGIYPEGTRSPDGRLYRGRTGAARLVLTSQAVVVPVGIVNGRMRKGFLGIPMMDRPGIRIGRPLDFEEYRGRPFDRHVIRWVTDQMMAAIQQLTGQTYVDAYATAAKSGGAVEDRVRERPGLDAIKPEPPTIRSVETTGAPDPVAVSDPSGSTDPSRSAAGRG